jgi:hypothetical protein
MLAWRAAIMRCSLLCGWHWAIHLAGSGHMEEFSSILHPADGVNRQDRLIEHQQTPFGASTALV